MTATIGSYNHNGEAGFKTGPLYKWNMESQAREKVNQGGSSAGKTIAILQVLAMKAIEKKRIITVIGQDIPNLKKGALRDWEERILSLIPWLNNYILSSNKTERKYTFYNGSILEFTSFKDEQDAKNGKRDIAFFNEANGIAWPIVNQIRIKTTEEIYYDYNPTSPFWIHDRIIGKPGVETFYSNFTHNPFLHENIRDSLYQLREDDLEAWKVYGLGKTGQLADLVIPKVEIIDSMPQYFHRWGYGIDFGYRADPTAFILCGWANERDLYLDEKFYTRGMSGANIATVIKALKASLAPIFADSADPRLIDDIRSRGIKRVIAAEKGPDSVRYGLNLINQYNIFITKKSVNLINEQKKYRYKADPKTGLMTNTPIDAFNHAWDAIRYWSQYNLKPIRQIDTKFRGAVA
mgnify:CR=1 FL=1